MTAHLIIYSRAKYLLLLLLLTLTMGHMQASSADSVVVADTVVEVSLPVHEAVFIDSLGAIADSMAVAADSAIKMQTSVGMNTSLAEQAPAKEKRDWSTWRPNPQRALWLALVIPGGGQVYNRKYWKLPLVYGGFMGCIYALTWNNMMYRDYQQAYLDIMDDDPGTASYNKFLHLGKQIDDTNVERYKQLFKSRKDKYRRWRDLSFFVMIGVYAISVIDAYVDAELSDFDLSKDLSLKVRPAVMGNGASRNPLYATSVGVNCSLNF